MFNSGIWQRSNGAEDMTDDGLEADHSTASPQRNPEYRFRVGLALGGGAARGWAHIGVLRALLEEGYSPDVIAGTSIGAVVGGCYAANQLDELEEFARSLSKRRLFTLMDLAFAGGGLFHGNRLAELLERGLKGIRIEELGKRFVSVATELRNGHEIWMTKGELAHAMRASYALPGIFKPVEVHGRWLVDGAVVNPVPVSVCRAFGARLVIAVNLNNDVTGRGGTMRSHDHLESQGQQGFGSEEATSSPPGISSVMASVFNIVQDRVARSRLAGDPPDIMISPKLANVGMFEFHRAEEAIAVGYEATKRQLEEISESFVALS